jgi:putative sigma-54 modulation protein
MKIIIKAQHVTITDSLKEYANKKVKKLEKFFDHIQSISIGLDVLGVSNENETQEASATILASGTIIRGKECSKDMYASIDVLVDKLEIQLVKHKEKVRDHKKHPTRQHHHENHRGKVATDYSDSLELHYMAKPIDPEDAVTLLEERKLNFIVFRDIEKERVCVVYPLASGEYGLIET